MPTLTQQDLNDLQEALKSKEAWQAFAPEFGKRAGFMNQTATNWQNYANDFFDAYSNTAVDFEHSSDRNDYLSALGDLQNLMNPENIGRSSAGQFAETAYLLTRAYSNARASQPGQAQGVLDPNLATNGQDLPNPTNAEITAENPTQPAGETQQQGDEVQMAAQEANTLQPMAFKSEFYTDPTTGEQKYGVNPLKVEAYAAQTGVAPAVPNQVPAIQSIAGNRSFSGLTEQQVQELDRAFQRVQAGNAGDRDQINLDYARDNYGYTPPGQETGFEQDPEAQAIAQMRQSSGLSNVDPAMNPVEQFRSDYSQIYSSLGLPTVKSLIESVNNEIRDIEDERVEKIADINDNPWLTEGARLRRIKKINEVYDGKTSNLKDQFDLYESLFEQGVEQAQFIATNSLKLNMWAAEMSQDILFKEMELAQKREDALNDVTIQTNNDGDVTAISKQTGEVLWTQKGVAKLTKYPVYANTNKSSEPTLTDEEKEFEKDITSEQNKLFRGGSWADSWNYLKNKYPDIPNETLDAILDKNRFYTQE